MSELKKIVKDISEWAAIADTLISDDSLLDTITNLQSRLEKAESVIDFYGSKGSWYSNGILHKDKLVCPDMENIGTYNCGGKRAREYRKEFPKEGRNE